jgi:hypothetical protein
MRNPKETRSEELLKKKEERSIARGKKQIEEKVEEVALRTLNDTLHNIEVITYDEIVARAHRIVQSYDKS